jgi:hypothetical protein
MDHVVEKHIKKKIRFASAGSAVRKAVASQQNAAGEITGSAIIATHALRASSTSHSAITAGMHGRMNISAGIMVTK